MNSPTACYKNIVNAPQLIGLLEISSTTSEKTEQHDFIPAGTCTPPFPAHSVLHHYSIILLHGRLVQ